MHPRIARLYIHNYRSFVNFELRPGRRSLLLGYNGTGKSSVFDVLAAICNLVVDNDDAKDAFPTDTVTKFGGSPEQQFELDIDTEQGLLRYALRLSHHLEEKTAAIASEELSLDSKPLYSFSGGEVQLRSDGDGPAKGPFQFSPQRSYLASFDPRSPLSLIAIFKNFLDYCWNLRLDPVRISASATSEDSHLLGGGENFASFCRQSLQEDPENMQRAHEALQRIIPGFRYLRLQSAGRAKVLVATFNYPGGNTYDIDFDALSDGQKTLIVLYVVLCGKHNMTALCLDEPDNFVSIREIQPFLTELSDISDETGLQVIIISHSPEVIDYLGPEGAILLERPEGGHTRIGTLPTGGALRLSELMARGWLSGGSNGAA
jgi:ABC-type multidrug transport system ATPase subunit